MLNIATISNINKTFRTYWNVVFIDHKFNNFGVLKKLSFK